VNYSKVKDRALDGYFLENLKGKFADFVRKDLRTFFADKNFEI